MRSRLPLARFVRWARGARVASLLALGAFSFALVATWPRPAFAAGSQALTADDVALREAIQQVMNEDYPANLAAAKKRLQEHLGSCLKKGCAGAVKADAYLALGMVSSQLGQVDDAKQNFKSAFGADPAAKLPSSGVTPLIKTQFDDASAGPGVVPPAAAEDEAAAQGGGIAGAIKLMTEALKADQEGRLDECIEKDKAALRIEEQPRTRMHLASCESRNGKLVDALRDAQKALELGIAKRDAAVMKVARTRVKELIERIPHVTFVPPPGVQDLAVRFDERPVPTEALTKKFSVDPGKHRVVAEGSVNGFPATFDEEYDIHEKEFVTVRITLKPPANDYITPGQIKCMLSAKNQEDVQKCLPQNRKNVVIRAAIDLSAYSDTNSVAVYTPGINVAVVSPTAGWNFGGSFIIDAVSAASPDIVSTASPPFAEYRYGASVTGGFKPGLYGAQVSASTSTAPDYVSYTGGIRLTADLKEKLITPTLGYSYSSDSVGRGPKNYQNDFNPLKGRLSSHEIEAGITFITSPTSVLLIGGTMAFERGDQSQPYRYVAMFDPQKVAPFVPNGATVDLVNRTRLPIRPLEQVPTERDRFAVGARFNKRLGSATLRLEQRFYRDTWSVTASSTDMRYMLDLSRHLRVWPHLRLHGQTGANFFQLAYGATLDSNGGVTLPLYRTGDRELAPLLTGTGGGGLRIGLGAPEGDVKYGITVVGDVMYTRYLKALYVSARTAVYGSVGFDLEF